MKKYFWTLSVMALFAIGFTSSDENENSSSSTTEQKQETEAERQERERQEEAERQERERQEEADRQAREQKEKESQQEKMKKEMAEAGYERGFELGFANRKLLPNEAETRYSARYGAPTNNEKMELFKIYKENFYKGYEEGKKAR